MHLLRPVVPVMDIGRPVALPSVSVASRPTRKPPAGQADGFEFGIVSVEQPELFPGICVLSPIETVFILAARVLHANHYGRAFNDAKVPRSTIGRGQTPRLTRHLHAHFRD